ERRCDAGVVAQQVALRVAALGKVDLAQVGELDDPIAELQRDGVAVVRDELRDVSRRRGPRRGRADVLGRMPACGRSSGGWQHAGDTGRVGATLPKSAISVECG